MLIFELFKVIKFRTYMAFGISIIYHFNYYFIYFYFTYK